MFSEQINKNKQIQRLFTKKQIHINSIDYFIYFQYYRPQFLSTFYKSLYNKALMISQPKSSHPSYSNTKPQSCWQRFLRRPLDYNQLLDRTIVSNLPDPQLPDNKIDTAKYNLLTFLPLNLILQFTKPSNIYFLIIGVLQTIPAISLSQGKPTIFYPLAIVVAISMVKDFIQDRRRHFNDIKQNQSQVECLGGVGFVVKTWQDLKVGQIIKIKKDQYFPCDVLLIDYPREHQTAFIQTKNLDGQTNLKLKKTNQHLDELRGLPQLQLCGLHRQFSFEKPNPFLSTFNGNVKIAERKYGVDVTSVVLRGCSLKINEWAIGMCLYTGHETKIMLNSGRKTYKVSSLETYLNSYFKYIFLFQLAVTLLSSIISGILLSVNQISVSYLRLQHATFVNIIFTWGSWFISFSNFIPISLVVTVQLVRYGQGILLRRDNLCRSKGHTAQAQTSSLNEQLGQIKYVLSDKTGTLTQNLMQFKCIHIDGQHYGQQQDAHNNHQSINSNRVFLKQDNSLDFQLLKKQSTKVSHVDFPSFQKHKMLQNIRQGTRHGQNIRNTLIHLALCHNVITQKNSYSSSSPDQVALASFAKYMGFEFIQKNWERQMVVKDPQGKILKYQLLHTLQFSSDRKRMSVIVRDLNHQKKPLRLLSKGADEIMLARMCKDQLQTKQQMNKVLYEYACKGLRTLVLAQAQIDHDYYQSWNDRYLTALAQIGPQRFQKIQKLQSQIQQQWRVIGATAIQDKLQPEVRKTIQSLKQSGMKVWMLTGDKKQTAISIGFAAGLIQKNMQRIVLDCDAQHAKALLVNLTSMLHLINNKKVTVISGDFIKKIDSQALQYLINILKQSQSVICCRVSPKDKQQITRMVKQWGTTLAIGDGANDVNMINCANVGVGVRGIQGSQATRAADYVISQFQLLSPLVIFHGQNYYHRNSNVMLYTLYKNMLVTLPNLLYGPLSMQSGDYIYDIWVVQFFNIFYVSLPILYYGLFDTLHSYKQTIRKPWTYTNGQNGLYFSKKLLIVQLIKTILVSAFICYVVFFTAQPTLNSHGLNNYAAWSGNLIFAIVVLSCNVRIIIMSNQFNILLGILCLSGVLLYYLTYYLISIISTADSSNTLAHQMTTNIYWLLLLFLTFLIQGIQVFIKTISNMDTQIAHAKMGNKRQMEQEIELADVREYSVNGDQIVQSVEMGGYAFAEDQNRMKISARPKSSQFTRGQYDL